MRLLRKVQQWKFSVALQESSSSRLNQGEESQDLNIWHHFLLHVFLEISHTCIEQAQVYLSNRKKKMSAWGNVAADKHNKSQDSGQLQKPKPKTQTGETKSAKYLLWCNDKNIWILKQQSPSAISIKMNSTKVFILDIKKHPSELFISFCDLRGDGMAQHSLL